MIKEYAYLARVFLTEKVKKVFATSLLRCFRGEGALMLFSWKFLFRTLLFPFILSVAYLLQVKFPWLFEQGALWSDHPHGWQFFTNGFLSGNWIHLLFNACAIWVVCSQFASQIRLMFLFIYFVLFSAASSFLYFRFFMPPHAWLVGASGGCYALMGFLCWFQRRDKVYFCGIRKLTVSFFPAVLILFGLEYLVATFWIPVLAWQLHIIAFSISIAMAMAAHAVYAGIHWLADQIELFEPGALLLRKLRATAMHATVENVF
jgi:membrane associated rhomboid family serine protease